MITLSTRRHVDNYRIGIFYRLENAVTIDNLGAPPMAVTIETCKYVLTTRLASLHMPSNWQEIPT